MAGNNSPWQGDKKSGGASVEADQEKPTFSGDDMEFESFMFNDGELSSTTQATAVATASPPVSATLDPVPSQPVEQPAMEETVYAEAGQSPDVPMFSFEASGPVDTAPVDPADMVLPSTSEAAPGGIEGEDVPLPFHLQTSEPEIPPFVPELPIKPLRRRQRSTGALPVITTGPLEQASPSMASVNGDSPPLQAPDAMAADGWTDTSLSAVEDFSSVLLAMQAGSHFPLTSGGAAVLDAQPSGMVDDAPAQHEATTQSIQPLPSYDAPPPQETLRDAVSPPEVQAPSEPVEAADQSIQMLDDGHVVQEDRAPAGAATLESAAPQAEMQQESARLEAPVPMMDAAAIKPEEQAQIEEGQFKGSDFEFESFMFTAPTTVSQDVMNTPAETAQPVSNDTSPQSSGALPFWLQTGELPALPDQRPADASPNSPAEATMAEMKAQAAGLEMQSAPTLESIQQNDYADLPPIDPFDFSQLGHVEEEESLGFNLQELEGMIPADRISTKVTTDLSALAEFLGTKPEADTGHYRTAEKDEPVQLHTAEEEAAAEPQAPVSSQAEVEPEPPADKGKGKGTTVLAKGTTVLGKGTTGLHSQSEDNVRPPSWTSTVTSSLSGETREQVEQQAAEAALEAGVEPEVVPASETMQQVSVVEAQPEVVPEVEALAAPPEIEIDPFNYTDLDLDDEEAATEQLSSMATSAITSTNVLDKGGQPTVPVLKPQAAYGGDLASGIPLDTGSFDDENDTSFFSSAQPTKKVSAKSTGWLSDTEGQAAGEEVAQGSKAKSGSKARVARGNARESKLLDAADDSLENTRSVASTEEEAMTAPPADSPVEGSQPANYVSSGPLPTMEGFEALHEMVDRNPDDLSTQMALAAAYSQSGEYDAALRTYRRVLKKRSISLAMLEVIAEELSDIDAEASNLPRFHQVLGDLYMKQGRYKDAIDEYNKIG